MALYERKQPDFEFADARGSLTQLVHRGYTQINVLESRKGVTRGGHYHKISREAFFVVEGSVDVTLKRGEEREQVTFSKGEFFQFSPYVVHSMYFPEDCILFAMYDIPVENEDGTKDIYAEEV